MKHRLALFILCIILLAGMLYWIIPQWIVLYNATGGASATPAPTATSIIVTPTTSVAQTVPSQTITGLSTENVVALAVLCIGFLILVQVLYSWSRHQGRDATKYGSAHFARGSELREFRAPLFKKRPPESRLILGRSSDGRLVSLSSRQQEANILLTAPVGSGKTSRVIIPNLLRERGSRSLFISDVKGELLKITAGTVSQSHEVLVFAPGRPKESHGYNPLAHVKTVEDAQDLAQCWVSNTGWNPDVFWPNMAKKLMVAVVLHLKETEPDAPFARVAGLLCSTSYDELKATLTESPSKKAQEETTAFFEGVEKNERLVGSIMTDVRSRFQLLLSDDIKAVTSRNEIDFERMVEYPTAFYLSIPRRSAERCQPLLATLVMQMFSSFEREAEQSPKGRLPRGMMCYFDEFTNLGYIPGFGGYISTARSSGVAMFLAIQSFSQLEDRYGRAMKENILSNTVNHLLLPGAGLEETKYYSQRLGLTTITTESHNSTLQPYRASTTSMPMLVSSMSRGHTEGQSQRSLQTADELRTMKKGSLLFVNASSPAAMLSTTAYFEDRKLAKLAEQPFMLDLPGECSGLNQEDEMEVTTSTVMEPWSALVREEEQETEEEEIPRAPEERS